LGAAINRGKKKPPHPWLICYQADFDINSIERLMLEQNRKVKQVLEKANAELSGSVEVAVKKMPGMPMPS
jgi:hypothetical protein